jgi:uncharacterized ferritin-like protein (DUF455 family)
MSVRERAGAALACADLDRKAALVGELRASWDGGAPRAGAPADPPRLVPVEQPGRPSRPVLVAPRQLRARKLTTAAGRVAAVHAVAHIEANAVNLALDAVHRFGGLPAAYYGEWLRVADEEARHFLLLRSRLRDLGADYGDLPAHDGLWAMAVRTADDPLRRMALVPRVLEARGLDVSPAMIERFEAVGDGATAAALRLILREEVFHVEVGSRWFRWLCAARGLEPEETFRSLLQAEGVRVVPPLNEAARLAAGFSAAELAGLAGLAGAGTASHGGGAGPRPNPGGLPAVSTAG